MLESRTDWLFPSLFSDYILMHTSILRIPVHFAPITIRCSATAFEANMLRMVPSIRPACHPGRTSVDNYLIRFAWMENSITWNCHYTWNACTKVHFNIANCDVARPNFTIGQAHSSTTYEAKFVIHAAARALAQNSVLTAHFHAHWNAHQWKLKMFRSVQWMHMCRRNIVGTLNS